MKNITRAASRYIFFPAWLMLVTNLFVPMSIWAQGTTGQNDVYDSGGNQKGSSAFIDASVFAANFTNPTFCSVLAFILSPSNHVLPPSGGVVDARGLPGNTGTSMTCPASQPSPWYGLSGTIPPSTILLPAGVISITGTWTLPDGTKIIGEGAGGFTTSTIPFVSTTTLQACNTSMNNNCQTSFSGTVMVRMCNSSTCHSVAVEDLSLDGQSVGSPVGISNTNSQELSYVNRVNLYRVLGVGLSISGSAYNSGPYSNIIYNTGSSTSPSTCAQIAVQPPRWLPRSLLHKIHSTSGLQVSSSDWQESISEIRHLHNFVPL
jgi:hypothetical protein